jgi:hypothetical protein
MMYDHFKDLHAEFMAEDQLRQLFHCWDTNAVEGFNKLITKLLLKDRTFCKTIENFVRIHLAMYLLSIGYEKTYERVFALTGLSLGSFTFLYLRAEDKQRRWRRPHRKKPFVKKNQMLKFYKRLRDGGQKLVQEDNA